MSPSHSPKNYRNEKALVLNYLKRIIDDQAPGKSLTQFYESSLETIVDELIKHVYERKISSQVSCQEMDLRKLAVGLECNGINGLEAIGDFYERFSGWSLKFDEERRLSLEVSSHKRQARGQFYTPKFMARGIVSLSLDALDMKNSSDLARINILDPAVGCGVFLLEAAEEIQTRLCKDDAKSGYTDLDMASRIHGIDIDPVAVRIARLILETRFRMPDGIGGATFQNIRPGNSLTGPHPATDFKDREPVKQGLGVTGYSESAIAETSCESLVGFDNRVDWLAEFPHVFSGSNPGFDLILGNPPYEVLSVGHPQSQCVKSELQFFRSNYSCCLGKINTYRLMIERSLNLLKKGGVLGFIVPATFLADTTASNLRRRMLAECEIVNLIVIPESARVFQGVTQALSIIIARKGKPTKMVGPSIWSGDWQSSLMPKTEMDVASLENTGLRIPVLNSDHEAQLVRHLSSMPTLLTGRDDFLPIRAHQGEINLTTHRQYISERETKIRLVRGEHVQRFVVRHPSRTQGRLDWMKADVFNYARFVGSKRIRSVLETDGINHGKGRVVLARVVNMGSQTRLKAAWIERGTLLGDMTNFLDNIIVSRNFTLGLLNSSLLNWRFKCLSANNYISAAEIESLPVPYDRLRMVDSPNVYGTNLKDIERKLVRIGSISQALDILNELTSDLANEYVLTNFLIGSVEGIVDLIMEHSDDIAKAREKPCWTDLFLDALILKIYSADEFVNIFEKP